MAIDTPQDHVPAFTLLDSSLDELVAAQGHIHLDPILTELSLEPLVTDTLQGPVCSGSTAVDPSLTELAIVTSQNRVRPGSMGSDSSLDEPTTRSYKLWKDSWDEKMLLVRLKREGRDWDYIIKIFWRLDKPHKGRSAWWSMWRRSAHDINVLGKAARADRESEVDRLSVLMSHHSMVDVARIDYEGIWERISKLMGTYGTKFQWTPERVEYAWTHGVSDMFPDIVLRQRQFSRHISADFVKLLEGNVSLLH